MVVSLQPYMRIADKSKLVIVQSVFNPNVRTFKKASIETGRSRQFLCKSDLTFGIVLHDKESDDAGIKVIIDDDKYKFFLKYCKMLDSKRGRKN